MRSVGQKQKPTELHELSAAISGTHESGEIRPCIVLLRWRLIRFTALWRAVKTSRAEPGGGVSQGARLAQRTIRPTPIVATETCPLSSWYIGHAAKLCLKHYRWIRICDLALWWSYSYLQIILERSLIFRSEVGEGAKCIKLKHADEVEKKLNCKSRYCNTCKRI